MQNLEKKTKSENIHDARTSLAIIETSSEVAMLDNNLNFDIRNIFKNHITEVDRILKILNDLF